MPIIIELPKCSVCNAEYKDGQVIAGVRIGHEVASDGLTLLNPGTYHEGHYDCVVSALGPELTLAAIAAGRLASRKDAMALGVVKDPATGALVPVEQPGPKPQIIL